MSYMHHKNINYTIFSQSKLQLTANTAYRSLQKIANIMVRHLTRPQITVDKKCYFDAAISPKN